MPSPARTRRTVAALVFLAALATLTPAASGAPAQTAFALSNGSLLSFDPATPQTVTTKAVTGLTSGETLVSIDVRPQNGFLYGLGVNATNDTATLYAISRQTGFAGVVGTSGSIAFVNAVGNAVDLPDPAAVGYGFDFNPAADRLRATAGGLNFRVNPNTGAPTDGDLGGPLGSVGGINPDGPISGSTTSVSEIAYTNNTANNGNITTVYALSAANDQLSIQNTPNSGTQTSPKNVAVGGLPISFSAVGGFDIDASVSVAANNAAASAGSGFAALTIGGVTQLYSIDLTTGAATAVGTIGSGALQIQGLALQRDLDDVGYPVVGLNLTGTNLVRFGSAVPGTTTTVGINAASLGSGETLVALAWRPQTGQLYGLGVNASSEEATLYLVDPQSAALTTIGATGTIAYVDAVGSPVDLPDPTNAGWAIDFNPTVDRIRVVAGNGFNARMNASSGAPIDGNFSAAGINPDASHNGLPGGATGVTAVAYTNAYPQVLIGGTTTQYVLEPFSNQLFIQNPPNAGTLVSPQALTLTGAPVDFANRAALDIPGEVSVASSGTGAVGEAIAVLTIGGTTSAYRLNLASGALTSLGALVSPLGTIAVGEAQRDSPVVATPAPTITPSPESTPAPTTAPAPAPTPFVDRTAPTVTLGKVTKQKKTGRQQVAVTSSETATLTGAIQRRNAKRKFKQLRTIKATALTKGTISLSLGKLAKGTYKLVLTAKDPADNSAPATKTFTVR